MMQDENIIEIFRDKIPMPEVWCSNKWSLDTRYQELSFYPRYSDEADYVLEIKGGYVERDGYTFFNVYDGCGGVFQVIVKDSNRIYV